MKRKMSMLLMLVLVFSMMGFGFAAEDDTVEITIFHTNDAHARVESSASVVGYAKIAKLVNQEKALNPNVLLLDAGDATHGQTIATLVKGESIVDIYNAVGYDAMTLGNHDFNYGKERVLQLEEMANYPFLAANVINEDGTPFVERYVIKEVGGVKVGVFGLATPETYYKSHPDNTKGLKIENPIETAKAMVAELEGKADLIVVLSHLGLEPASEFTDRMIAYQVPGVDLIIGGHSHTRFSTGIVNNGVTIVQTGGYNESLGRIDITWSGGEIAAVKPYLIPAASVADLAEDETVKNLITELKGEQDVVTSVVVGSTSVELIGARELVRTGETNLGNLITQAMLHVTGADVAITNGGGIRASIDVGDITVGEVSTVLPFGNYIVTKSITGEDLLKAIEHGLTDYPNQMGAFPHLAGIRVQFDPSKEVGKRVVTAMIDGKAIDPAKSYLVATNDFMAAGGDDYQMFKTYPEAGLFMALDEALVKYIKEVGVGSAAVDGRIKVYDGPAIETPTTPVPAEPAAPTPVPVPEGQATAYTVVSGDTLSHIALKHNTTWQKLAEYNKLSNPNLILPGQVILIPAM
ncbi:5'-nucleotidase C-terminal domain-containing protein [Acidaminobacter hydrogenoformans]|uniref:2',3'-cyclic-nucleotide 2'-phosphodiesterase/5'-or 3'-nucleotidase, 5'-nucleotidase family n=1 Tax=Acidaminobacter hydrogenoformans DSM 2784 TaxID=1120920 RepID=A0A1G5S4Z5_9FIRM|nr:5'-nucleotidase C-terminal domain-containing protein [Acidaminobacter hydrogenoformans]SCZ81227.1 2',3'-cyclic-nucleotide 2'-phosphodiesterase/5'-or 3'-nucleotidase, 5'-nucleotidase family [Acidaminobacter hydrogenoformans DSM 2784]